MVLLSLESIQQCTRELNLTMSVAHVLRLHMEPWKDITRSSFFTKRELRMLELIRCILKLRRLSLLRKGSKDAILNSTVQNLNPINYRRVEMSFLTFHSFISRFKEI